MTQRLTLSLGLRYDVHISPITEHWNPFFSDPNAYPVDKNNIQPRVGVRLQPEPDVGDPRRLRHVLREAVDRSVRELLAEPRVHRTRSWRSFRSRQADPGPSNGRFPTDPLLVNGPVLNRALRRSAGAAGHAGPQYRRRLARHAGSHSSVAAAGVDRLRASDRPAAVVRGRLHAHREPRSCRSATT